VIAEILVEIGARLHCFDSGLLRAVALYRLVEI
jgi:hypothetical protein